MNNEIIQDKETLISLDLSIKELIITYEVIERLSYLDITNALVKTAINTRLDLNLKAFVGYNLQTGQAFNLFSGKAWTNYGKNWFLMNLGFGLRGGYVVFFLFRRRLKKIFKFILSACYLYLSQEKNSENAEMAQKIIENLVKYQQQVSEKKPEALEKVSSILQISSVILGIPIIASLIIDRIMPMLANFFPQVSASYSSSGFALYSSFVLPYFIILVLEIPLYWILPKIRWYRKLVKMYNVKDKETDVYDSLVPLERIVINNAFPKIKGILDEPTK